MTQRLITNADILQRQGRVQADLRACRSHARPGALRTGIGTAIIAIGVRILGTHTPTGNDRFASKPQPLMERGI